MNNEEVSIKITTPLFEKAELDLLNNYNETMHSMVEEYVKMYLEDKEKVITQRIIICQQEKIEQLTNNWNELEEWVQSQSEFDEYKDITYRETMGYVLDKMKEIKDNDKV